LEAELLTLVSVPISPLCREKQSSLIQFPLRSLDLTPWIPPHALENEPQPIYDLYAISNHSGGMSGGHYTTFALHFETGKWYHFDDSRVSEVQTNQLQTSFAYMLMYKRRV
jgi:hypothetical protein